MSADPLPGPAAGSRRSTSCLAGWLAVTLVMSKAFHVEAPAEATFREGWRAVSDLLIVSAADVAYAFGLWVVGEGLLRLAAGRARARKVVWRALLVLAVVSVFYAVVSIQVFAFLRSPLTYAWLYVADQVGNMRSSIAPFVTPWVLAQMVGVPALYLFLVAWCRRRSPALPQRWRRVGVVAACVVVVGWNVGAQRAVAGAWGSRHDDRLLAQNPHVVLVDSLVRASLGGGLVTLDEPFPEEDLADFRPAGERPDGGRPTEELARGPRNVLLVVIESGGTQHMSLYGSRYRTMPRLEEDARHALVVEGFYAHITNTANSLAAMTLSIYPPGLSYHEVTKETPDLPGASLAEVLRNEGWRTAFISSGDNEYARQGEFLRHRGFDTIWDWRDSGRERLFSWGVADEAMVDSTLRWIDEGDRARPFFAMTWTQGTHHPYEIPWEREKIDFFRGDVPHDDWDLGNYLNALHETDLQLRRLLDGLRERGLADDTLVVVTGDHGEAFGVPHPNYGHSYKVYEEDVNVPLVLWNPRLWPEGARRELVGGHVDLAPTVLDLLGFASPATWQGRSLFSASHPRRAYFYGARDPYTLGVREGRFKYVLNVSWGAEELYDLVADPDEQRNVRDAHPNVATRLRQRVAAWFHWQNRR